MDPYLSLLTRAKRLGLSADNLPNPAIFKLFAMSVDSGKPDWHLHQILDNWLDAQEAQKLSFPFTTPCVPPTGRTLVGSTLEGGNVGFDIAHGANPVQHMGVFGAVASGKTAGIAGLALSMRDEAHIVLIDSQNTFSQIQEIRESFEFAQIRDLRDEIFHQVRGLERSEQLLITLNGLADAQGFFELAELESLEAAKELDARGQLTLRNLRDYLQNKTYSPRSNRNRYRDTAVLHYSWLLDGTQPLFECDQGMALEDILSRGSVCLVLDSLQDVHRAYIIRRIFDFAYMLRRAGRELGKPLVLVIDEAQTLLEKASIAEKLLSLRHSGIHVVLAAQNPHKIPAEVFNNLDAFLVFALTDQRDRQHIARAINLTSDQEQYLPLLDKGQAIGFFPRSHVKHPFVVNMRWLNIDSMKRYMPTSEFFKQLPWRSLETSICQVDSSAGLDRQADTFLRDVLNQEFEFSGLTSRFQRCGIRSASKQGQIIKTLVADGLIAIHSLTVKRGAPMKLVEPTQKAFETYGVEWKKTRGSLPARAATQFLYQHLSKLEGWQIVREGVLKSERADGVVAKQVDLLCRDPDGELVTVEIAHSSGHEIHNALYCLRCEEVRKHVVVCTTKQTLNAVKDAFVEGGHSELGEECRLETRTLAQVLKVDWVP